MRLRMLITYLFLIVSFNIVHAQELSGGDSSSPDAAPEDTKGESDREAGIRHYAACDLPSKFKSLDAEKNKLLQAEYKLKQKDYSGCVPYGELLEKAKDINRAKQVYEASCKDPIKLPVACVRLGSMYLAEGSADHKLA